MTRLSAQDLDDIKARNPLSDIAGGYVKLRRMGKRLVGPCPVCGGKASSQRFEILEDGESWVCAVCPGGGDVIELVMKVEGCDFRGAIERLGGQREIDKIAAKKLFEAREEKRLEREKKSDDFREKERKRLWQAWQNASEIHGTIAARYLEGRGLVLPAACPGLRFLPQAPYFHGEQLDERGRKSPVILHKGPAMLAAFIRADGKFGGLHTTWLDVAASPDDVTVPKKIELNDPETGELLNAKKMRGSKAGAHIAIALAKDPKRLVIGEGIETVLAVWTAYASAGRELEDTAFWAAGDLGNMAGRSARTVPHPSLKRPNGRAMSVPNDQPDPDDPGLSIPESVDELILLGDGDSEPVLTRFAMLRAARRYARPGRTIRIAFAPGGVDFNDVLRNAGFEAVIELLDQAPVFAEPQPLSAEELRKAGWAALDHAIEPLKAADGDSRAVLTEVAEQVGAIAAAIDEDFAAVAKVHLENAAAAAGLIKAIGAKAVKAAIAAALKIGKKTPRDFSTDILSQSRPGAAGNSAAVHVLTSPSAADPEPASASPVLSPSPAPPEVGGESASSQTGAAPEADAAWGAGGDGDDPPTEPEDDDALNRRLAFYPHTDLGNAERFRERWKGKLLWCPALGWLAWDGKRWSRDGADDLVKIAEHKTVRAIQDEAELVRESGRNDVDRPERGSCDFVVEVKRDDTVVLFSDKIARWGRASEALNKLGALSKRGAPYFAIGIDKLDADKMKINVNNGTLSVARNSDGDYVTFSAHNPADLITKISPVDYVPAALCPEYDKFLARVQPSEDMRRWLHQWLGLSMTGDVSEQILAFLYGKGGNGKSVLIDAVSFVAGDYGETVPIETFLDHGKSRSAGQATPDLAILPGVRMLRTSEPEKNSKLAEAMVKLVTGGEPIQARHLNRDFFKFYPQFKLTISGNYRPTISGADEGIWRRLRLVPFDVTIPKEERDIHLAEKLRAEASGILNRLLDGLRLWCDKRLIEPEDVAKATAEYRSDSDAFGRFAATCLVASPGDRVQSSVLYAVYDAWCKSSGEKAWSARGLSMAMKERGYHSKQSNVMWWTDVKLIRDAHDFVDDQGRARVMTGENDGNDRVADAGDTPF